jgi:hypothetical protein
MALKSRSCSLSVAVFQPHQNPASDKPSHCSKSIASLLLRTAKAVLVRDRTIQMLAPTAEIGNVTITAEMQRQARYDIAVNRPPIGYQASICL